MKPKLDAMVRSVDSLCLYALEKFIAHVKSDQDKFIPEDATVHQLTSNALMFVDQLVDLKDCLATVLTQNSNDSPNDAIPTFFARILSALGLNLRNKAELYADPAQKAIFMLNNTNHIVKILRKSGVMKLVLQQNREVEGYYNEQLKLFKTQYLQR
ncbi:unnamed protein product [Soboliphyme baturini]|uniref:Exocyst complex component 7 n=1 Tax=Soboliphyme baturini TaxID=241478 RepID=A0A183J9X5_9BILA|nr:unnamed protein product [Soboliphyme baturini]